MSGILLSQRVGAALRSGLAPRVLFVSVLTESVIFVVFSLRHITCNTWPARGKLTAWKCCLFYHSGCLNGAAISRSYVSDGSWWLKKKGGGVELVVGWGGGGGGGGGGTTTLSFGEVEKKDSELLNTQTVSACQSVTDNLPRENPEEWLPCFPSQATYLLRERGGGGCYRIHWHCQWQDHF